MAFFLAVSFLSKIQSSLCEFCMDPKFNCSSAQKWGANNEKLYETSLVPPQGPTVITISRISNFDFQIQKLNLWNCDNRNSNFDFAFRIFKIRILIKVEEYFANYSPLSSRTHFNLFCFIQFFILTQSLKKRLMSNQRFQETTESF